MKKLLSTVIALIMMLAVMAIPASALEGAAPTIENMVFDTSGKSKEFNVDADFIIISLTKSKNVREIFGDLGYVVWSPVELTADEQAAIFAYLQTNGQGQFNNKMNAGNTEFLAGDNNPYTAGVTFALADGQISAISAEIKNSNIWNMVAYGALGEVRPEEPIVEEPIVEEPIVEEPIVEEPIVEEPIVEEPIVEEPIVEEPIVEEPIVEEPIVEEPIVEEPIVEEPIVEEPIVEEPIVEEPIVEEPIVEEPIVEEPIVEEPIVEEPIVEEPIVEEPIVEEPIVEEPVVEEPVVEEPVVEEPIALINEEPVVEEPVVLIEETEVPLADAPVIVVEEQLVALADVPKTGDPLTVMAIMSLLSGAGVCFTRKRDEE